jgi:methionyl-tRNA formyltransferase
MGKLRIIFMGSAQLACPTVQALADHPEFDLLAVVTQPDRPKGRHLKVVFSEVKALAVARGLPVLQPERARGEPFLNELRQLEPELIVVVAYGQILPPAILELPRYGCLNVHTSLLPKYRGAAPIQWAILEGDTVTGVTIMKMDAGLDTGPILTRRSVPIGSEDNAQTLHDTLAHTGAELLIDTIPRYVSGEITPQPQPAEGSTYARKITKEDGRLDWRQPANQLHNRIRAFTPWPGTFTFQMMGGKPRLLKIWKAEVIEVSSAGPGKILETGSEGIVVGCGESALKILELQPEGGRRMSAEEFLRGHPLRKGDEFSISANL